MNEELKHHGIKGMKWGVRRFQNADGSLTPAGKKRYDSKENFEKQYPEDVKKNLKTAKSSVDKGKKYLNKANDINTEYKNKKEKQMKKEGEAAIRDRVYKMSDKELRDTVNRLNMEERYTQVMRDRMVIDVGKSRVDKVLEYAGTALTIGSSALSIMIALKELQKK